MISFTKCSRLDHSGFISTYTGARVVGICDTPAELFFRISLAFGTKPDNISATTSD